MILKPSKRSLSLARRILKKGGIVSIPTETYYALCTNALEYISVIKTIKLKGRKKSKGIPIFVKSSRQLLKHVRRPNEKTKILMEKFWPGPLSLIFYNKSLPKILEGDKKSVLARKSSGKILTSVLKKLPFPLTATSANISGRGNPKSARYVKRCFGEKVDLIIDGGHLKAFKPSTIVDSRGKYISILREGIIPKEKILSCLKKYYEELN